MSTKSFILASSSPQRRILLERMGLDFVIKPIECPEDLDRDEIAEAMVERISREKMSAAFAQLSPVDLAQHPIICSDTLVSMDHHRLGKPRNRDEARSFLQLLSGKTHQVLTAICLSVPDRSTKPIVNFGLSTSHVQFIPLNKDDINWYLDTNEWDGAAGGYRIQGKASCLIERIVGSPTGIMGLPLELLYGMIRSCHLV